MLYSEYLAIRPASFCPFCEVSEERKFIVNDVAFLTYGVAPYHEHHLLVVPKKHHVSFMTFGNNEAEKIWDLIRKGAGILLELGYDNYSVLVREGKNESKSIEHVHYHIIPNSHIGDMDHDGNRRRIMTEKEIKTITKDIESAMERLTYKGL